MFTVTHKESRKLVNVYDIGKGLNLKNSTTIQFLVFLDNEWQYVDANEFRECETWDIRSPKQ